MAGRGEGDDNVVVEVYEAGAASTEAPTGEQARLRLLLFLHLELCGHGSGKPSSRGVARAGGAPSSTAVLADHPGLPGVRPWGPPVLRALRRPVEPGPRGGHLRYA